MASYDDWWGFLIFVFFILAIALFIMKVLIEYPGLMELKLINSESTENLVEYAESDDVELSDVTIDVAKERDKKQKCYENPQQLIEEAHCVENKLKFPSVKPHPVENGVLLVNI